MFVAVVVRAGRDERRDALVAAGEADQSVGTGAVAKGVHEVEVGVRWPTALLAMALLELVLELRVRVRVPQSLGEERDVAVLPGPRDAALVSGRRVLRVR